MAIQEEMYKDIVTEIDATVAANNQKIHVNVSKAKEVAKMLTDLSVDPSDADTLTNQYIARIKNICSK
ncbi:MAG: hypothetical protein SO114_00780 [Candidatus Cryptobacteroides sp.]|nr:hypothetical protein [Candidatus Cryptobacteroides sp.]